MKRAVERLSQGGNVQFLVKILTVILTFMMLDLKDVLSLAAPFVALIVRQRAVTPDGRQHSQVRGPSRHQQLSLRRSTERSKSASGFIRRQSCGGFLHYRRQRTGPSQDYVALRPSASPSLCQVSGAKLHLTDTAISLIAEQNVNETSSLRWSALGIACTNGFGDLIDELLTKGADVTIADNDGWTSLLSASSNDHVQVVRLLLEKGPMRHAMSANT
ncbi:hypothetical protein B0J13DRAFT_526174 [Dactylonectria estremocensis]|uniref:Uncharacterized protein n=1 Tax=Dactylonectria estremocensis TaxID=1079267 RepID=A0A9P9J564_9HYPO|nr:hypothetical protein B0J13DRAFT_526174 [Dactylonectria estremocensis]